MEHGAGVENQPPARLVSRAACGQVCECPAQDFDRVFDGQRPANILLGKLPHCRYPNTPAWDNVGT
jgi:hypothetical protein